MLVTGLIFVFIYMGLFFKAFTHPLYFLIVMSWRVYTLVFSTVSNPLQSYNRFYLKLQTVMIRSSHIHVCWAYWWYPEAKKCVDLQQFIWWNIKMALPTQTIVTFATFEIL